MAEAPYGTFAAVVLAAGRGTRFRSKHVRSKVLFPIAGVPMLEHILQTLHGMTPEQIIIVVNEDVQAEITEHYGSIYEMVVQEPQLGTGDALATAMPAVSSDVDNVLVLPGDVPLVTESALRDVLSAASSGDAALLTFTPPEIRGYGRVKTEDGFVTGIVEDVDADAVELKIKEVNSGIYAINRRWVDTVLDRAREEFGTDNRKGEYYLTDIVNFLRTRAVYYEPAQDLMGINDRAQLNDAEDTIQQRLLVKHARSGVTFVRGNTSYIEFNVRIGQDTTILPGTVLRGETVIGEDCEIGPMAYIEKSRLGDGCKVFCSRLVEVKAEEGVTIGPYANLRPGSNVEETAKIGSFVELKKSTIGAGSKVSHLSYIGDAKIGKKTNIGAGTITCNYDGFTKHRTTIGDGVFIGSNNTLVAPIEIGDGAYTAAGSTLTKDVPADALGVGRSRQENKESYAAKLREKKSTKPESGDEIGETQGEGK